jgi:hypothetical protein
MNLKHYLLLAPEPGDSGSEPTPLERGDILEEEPDIDPEDPDAEKVAADLTSKLDAEKTEPKEDRKDSRIPAARHKEILEKEREKRADLERQLAQYQNGKQVADVNTQITAAEDAIAQMDKDYRALLVEGELDKAGDLMAKIRKAEREMNESKSDMKIHAAEIRAVENTRYATTLERIENAYPELNPDHADYSEETMAEVAELMDAYKIKGFTPTVALQKAVKALVAPRTTKQELATSSTPRVSEKDAAAGRKSAAVGKTTKAVTNSPPSLSRVGQDHDAHGGGDIDAKRVMSMSQAEFAKLSPEVLSKMRGDTL